MRKFVSILICLLLLIGLAIPTFAAGVSVTFTDDSLPEAGGTLTVDTNALMNNGSITSEMYNALLEGNVIYSWYKNGTLTQEGTGADALSYQLSLSDQGCTFYVKVSFYEDDSFQETKKCAEAVSTDLKVNPAPAGTEPNPTPPESDPTQPSASAPTDATESTQDTTDVAQPGNGDNRQEFPWWGYLVIAVGGITVGIGIAFVFVKLKKKD